MAVGGMSCASRRETKAAPSIPKPAPGSRSRTAPPRGENISARARATGAGVRNCPSCARLAASCSRERWTRARSIASSSLSGASDGRVAGKAMVLQLIDLMRQVQGTGQKPRRPTDTWLGLVRAVLAQSRPLGELSAGGRPSWSGWVAGGRFGGPTGMVLHPISRGDRRRWGGWPWRVPGRVGGPLTRAGSVPRVPGPCRCFGEP